MMEINKLHEILNKLHDKCFGNRQLDTAVTSLGQRYKSKHCN